MQENKFLDREDLSLGADTYTESAGTPNEECEKEGEAYRVFKTQEEFQQCIDRALGKRLSKARMQSEELDEMRPVLKSVFERFGVSSVSELAEALTAEKNTQRAEENTTVSEAEISGGLSQGEAELAEAVERELQNLAKNQNEFYGTEQAKDLLADKRFKALVNSGFSVKEAFDALHLPQLLKAQADAEQARIIREIRLRGLRPDEDAVSGYGSFSASLDPRHLSDAQCADIRERVRRGERITF